MTNNVEAARQWLVKKKLNFLLIAIALMPFVYFETRLAPANDPVMNRISEIFPRATAHGAVLMMILSIAGPGADYRDNNQPALSGNSRLEQDAKASRDWPSRSRFRRRSGDRVIECRPAQVPTSIVA